MKIHLGLPFKPLGTILPWCFEGVFRVGAFKLGSHDIIADRCSFSRLAIGRIFFCSSTALYDFCFCSALMKETFSFWKKLSFCSERNFLSQRNFCCTETNSCKLVNFWCSSFDWRKMYVWLKKLCMLIFWIYVKLYD